MTAFFLLAGGWVIDLLTTAPEVRAAARVFLLWSALSPLIGLPSFMLDGIFIGATWTRAMRNAMILSVAGYALALWLMLPYGNHGLWAALYILYLLRAITLGVVYPRIPRSIEGSERPT
jgi:MATE family multidrug resistance protein